MLSSIIFAVAINLVEPSGGKGWYDIEFNDGKIFSNGKGFLCKLFVNEKSINLENMETKNYNNLNLSLEHKTIIQGNSESIEIVHKVENSGQDPLNFNLNCYSIVNIGEDGSTDVYKTKHGRGIKIDALIYFESMNDVIIYLDGSNSEYTYPNQMYFKKNKDSIDHFSEEFNEKEATTTKNLDYDIYAVGFRWTQQINGNEVKKLAVRMTYSQDEFPTLLLKNDKNSPINGYISNDIRFELSATNLVPNKDYILMINKGSSHGWTEECEFNSKNGQTIPVVLNFQEIGDQTVKFHAVMKNKSFFGTNTIDVHFNIKDNEFKLLNVQIPEVMVKGSSFTISGDCEAPPANGFKIQVKFDDGTILNLPEEGTQTEEHFEFTHRLHNIDKKKCKVQICGYDSTNDKSTTNIDFDVTITDRPSVSLKHPAVSSSSTIFIHEETFNITYTVDDDTSGNVSYSLFGIQSPLRNYNQETKEFNETITIPSGKKTGEHTMKFSVTDEFGISNSQEYKFTIIIPPVINSVTLDKERVDVNGTITATVNFTLYENSEEIYLYCYDAQKNGMLESEQIFPNDSCQILNLTPKFQKSGKINLKFNIQSLYSSEYLTSSDVFKTVIVTNIPKIRFNNPNDDIYGTSENISLELIIEDDSKGTISYSIGENTDLGYTKEVTEYEGEGSKNVDLPIPSNLAYGQTYTMNIKIIDEFEQESETKGFDFSIKHAPVIDESNSNIPTTMERNNEYEFTIVINDADENKPLYVYYRFNEEEYNLFGSSISQGSNTPVSVQKTIMISKNAGENQKISFYVIDNDSQRETKNAKSKVFNKTITITEGPQIQSFELLERSFNDTDSISVKLTIKSDVNGKARFELNGSLIYEGEFDTGNLNPTYSFSAINYSYGEKELVFYLNYGENKNSTHKTAKIMFRRKPSISNLQLTPSQIKDTESTTLSGNITDLDVSKPLYVMIQVGKGRKRRASENQQIMTNGEWQQFSYVLNNLATEEGNQLTVWVAEDPDPNAQNPQRYSVSDNYYVSYVISTPPTLRVQYPDKNTYEWNETIHLNISVDDEVSGRLVFQALEKDAESPKLIDFEKIEVKYNRSEIVVADIRINLKKSAEFTLNITAIGEDGGVFSLIDYVFTVFNKPKIINVELAPQIVSPGTDVPFNCTYTDSNNGEVLFLVIKFNNGDNLYLNTQHDDEDEETTFSINGNFTVPDDYQDGNNIVKFCLSYGDLYNPTQDCYNYNITVTKRPDINLSLADNVVTEGEQLNFSVSIDDDANSEGEVNISIEDQLVATLNYTNNVINGSVNIPQNYSRYGEYSIKAQAKDKYGLTSGIKEEKFNFKHQPELVNMSVTPNVLAAGGEITINGYIIDPDIGKDLYLYVQFGENDPYKLHSYQNHQERTIGLSNLNYIIPGKEIVGNKTFKVWVTECESGPNEGIKYSTSIPNVYDMLVIIKPTIDASLKSNYTQSNSSLTLQGYLNCSSPATIHYMIDGKEFSQEEISFEGTQYSLDDKTVKIPENYTFGAHSLTIKVSSYRFSKELSIRFNIKNKPSISNVTIGDEQYLLTSSQVNISGILNDIDRNKVLSFYIKFNGANETKLGQITSNGSQKNFTFNYKLPDTYGQHQLHIWCSHNKGQSEFDESEPMPKDILLTYRPILDLSHPHEIICQIGEVLPINFTAIDDSNCTIKLIYNDNTLNDYDVNVTSNNESIQLMINFTIPENSIKINSLQITSIDQYQKETMRPIKMVINIKNKPVIDNFRISSDALSYDETARISFLFKNKDAGDFYFFVKVGSNEAELIHKMHSDGNEEKQMELPFKAQSKYGKGENMQVTFWVQDNETPQDNPEKNSKSDDQNSLLTIKYRPSAEIGFPKNLVYPKNSSIKLTGKIIAEKDSTVKFMIDGRHLTSENYDYSHSQENKDLNKEILIPKDIGHGLHKLSVKVVDKESPEIESIEYNFNFFLWNKPVLSDVKLSSNKGAPGTKITITGKAFDPDANQNISIYAKLESDEQDSRQIGKLKSKAVKQDFSYEFQIKNDAKVGKTKIIIYASDDDNLDSSYSKLEFEVIKISPPKAENSPTPNNLFRGGAPSNGSTGGIIAGVIVALLIIAIIVGIVVYLKMKDRAKEADEPHEQSDVIEAETMATNNATQVEQTTMDDPLYTLNGREYDDGIFDSDEIVDDEVNNVML